jgi:hypothetical protein
MAFIGKLWRIELSALAALLICAVLMAAYGFFDALRAQATGSSPLLSPLSAAWVGFAYTGTIGVLPVILYGAPAYTFLNCKRAASWWAVLLVGLVPGVGVSFLERDLGGFFIVCGILVACITHFLSTHVFISVRALTSR